jgi:hypothetical protein
VPPLHFIVCLETCHEVVDIIHLIYAERVFVAVIDHEGNSFSIENIVYIVDQRAVQSLIDSPLQATFAFTEPDTDQGHTTVAHRRVDIGKVDVLLQISRNNLGDAFSGDRQCFIGFPVGLGDAHTLFGIQVAQAFVVDHQQRVHVLRHLPHAFDSFHNLLAAFKQERNRNDTDSQDTHLFRYLGYDRPCSRTCTTAHSGSDKGHTSTVVQHLADLIFAFESRLLASFRDISRSETTSRILSDQQFIGYIGLLQSLIIGITQHERDIVNAFLVHVADSITTTATDAYRFDDRLRRFCQIKIVCLIVHCRLSLFVTDYFSSFNASLILILISSIFLENHFPNKLGPSSSDFLLEVFLFVFDDPLSDPRSDFLSDSPVPSLRCSVVSFFSSSVIKSAATVSGAVWIGLETGSSFFFSVSGT